MLSSSAKIASLAVILTLCVSLIGLSGGQAAVAGTTPALPGYTGLVPQGIDTTGEKPGSLQHGKISVVVHVNMAPLAMVGRFWNHQQRVAYVQQVRAEQDKIIPQIQALGGTVVGHFAQASTGLAVLIDSSKTGELRKIANVAGVRGIGTYQLDLTETVPWIGGTAVQDLGLTGAGIDVAVIDSGIDYTHAKLGGPGTLAAYAEAYCGDASATPDPIDPACIAHSAPDASGFFPNAKVKGGWDWVGEAWPTFGDQTDDPNPIDFEGHGTHVADIIAGLETTDGAGDKGVAPDANIWSFKACSAVSSSCNGLSLLLAVDDALDLDDSDYGACTPGVDLDCLDYDPADVINMSLGSPYGQPEDDLTLFSDIASYYGSVVVVSAGNSGDIPYIVGSPSTASGAISVAQSTVPSDKFFTITAGSASVKGVLQPWSPAPSGPLSGVLQYGNGAGGNLNGCAAFPPGSLAGKVLLVDRGTCNNSIKGSNGSAGGAAFVVIANNAFSNTPPVFSYGGGTITVPTLTITQAEGLLLKTQVGQTAAIDPANIIPLPDDIVASSGRGPRISDGAIKPDIAAPGASVSAEVGTGTEKTAFGGTSGAAPMVSGAAALIVQALEQRGVLDQDPGTDGIISASPLVKSILMNNANPNTYIGGPYDVGGSGFLAPITLQGAGRVDVLKAYQAQTTAWDISELVKWDASGVNSPCPFFPASDVYLYLLFGIPPECAASFPFGNDFFNAWNAQTGSLSFGYDGVSTTASETHQVAISNFGTAPKTYKLSSSFRYASDVSKGATISFSSSSVTVPAGGTTIVDVTLKIDAKKLRDWTLDAGASGASGTNITCSDPTPGVGCPTLQIFELDGFVTINGGADNTVRLPWQVLPKKAAETYVASSNGSRVRLTNPAPYKAGDVDVFSLIDISPNNCEITDGDGNCVEENYVPGILPGINNSAIDIREVGVRSYTAPGLNSALGLPAAPFGAINDEVVDFALTVYDAPFRASHNYPVEFDIYVDSNSDGVDDYVVFNADLTLNAADGRNAVFVADINPADGTRPLRAYLFSFTDFNSQNWILPVPAAAVGIASNRPFKFFALAFDAYFTGSLWDCSPLDCGASYHTYQTGQPKYLPVTSSLQVKSKGSYTLPFSKPSAGATVSPSQIGLLFLYRDAKVGHESDSVTIP